MWPFDCNHPIAWLAIEKTQTVTKIDDEFQRVTYHYFCRKCEQQINKTHAELIPCDD